MRPKFNALMLALSAISFSAFSQPQDEFPLGVYLFGTTSVDFEQIATDLGATWVQGDGDWTPDGHDPIEENPGNLKVITSRNEMRDKSDSQRMRYEAENREPAAPNENLTNYFGAPPPFVGTSDGGSWWCNPSFHQSGYMVQYPRPNNDFHNDASEYYATFRMQINKGQTPSAIVAVLTVLSYYNNTVNNSFSKTLLDSDFPVSQLYYEFELPFFIEVCDPPCVEAEQTGFLTGRDGQLESNLLCDSINIRVDWRGNVETWVDYVIVDDTKGKDLFAGLYDDEIEAEVEDFQNNGFPLVQRFYSTDEPYVPEFLPFDYIDLELEQWFSGSRGRLITATYWSDNWAKRFVQDAQPNEVMFDRYVILSSVPSPSMDDVMAISVGVEPYDDNAQYNSLLQPRWDLLEQMLSTVATHTKDASIPFWYTPHLHGEYIEGTGQFIKLDPPGARSLRPPTGEEIETQIGLGLAFGAEGIIAYPFGTHYVPLFGGSEAWMTGLVSRFPDVNGIYRDHSTNITSLPGPSGDKDVYVGYQEKWDALSEIFTGLGEITDELLSLTWIGSKSWHSGTQYGDWSDPPITTVQTKPVSGSQFDPATEVLVGHLEGSDGKDYLCVVNRRCDPTLGVDTRDIHLAFDLPQSEILITNIQSNEDWIVAGSGTLIDRFEPGEFKIYRLGNVDLLELATRGKSISRHALQSNSQRKAVLESNGNLDAIFGSDNHIFHQRFPTSGSPAEVTTQLTSGADAATYPSITQRDNYIYAVWQRANTAGENTVWNIRYRYSTDGGDSWSTQSSLASGITCPSPGPLPVILAGIPSNPFELMVAYRKSDGIYTRRTTTSPGSTGWSAESKVSTTNSSSRNPSLGYQSNGTGYYRMSWVEDGKIYYCQYSNGWGNKFWINSGTYGTILSENSPSFALTGSNTRFISWEGISDEKDAIIANRNGSSVYAIFEPPIVYGPVYHHYFKPSVTGHAGGRASVVWYDSADGNAFSIRRAVYDPSAEPEWSLSVLGSDGFNPTTSIMNPAGGESKTMWTEGLQSPYALNLHGTGLNRQGAGPGMDPTAELVHGREIIIRDTLGESHLVLGLGALSLLSEGGTVLTPAFTEIDDTARYAPDEAVVLLETEPFTISPTMDKLVVPRLINTRYAGALTLNGAVTLEVIDATTRAVIFSFASRTLTGGDLSIDDTVDYVLNRRRLQAVQFRLKLDGLRQLGNNVIAAVIERYEELADEQGQTRQVSLLPAAVSLSQNYPNPFNPTSTISFEVPSEANVTLRVYDILGREVFELVNERLAAGSHQKTIDATSLSSGVYFYRLEVDRSVEVKKMLLMK